MDLSLSFSQWIPWANQMSILARGPFYYGCVGLFFAYILMNSLYKRQRSQSTIENNQERNYHLLLIWGIGLFWSTGNGTSTVFDLATKTEGIPQLVTISTSIVFIPNALAADSL